MTTNIWSIGLLCSEADGAHVGEFMKIHVIDGLFESLEILGEEAYEENFD